MRVANLQLDDLVVLVVVPLVALSRYSILGSLALIQCKLYRLHPYTAFSLRSNKLHGYSRWLPTPTAAPARRARACSV